MFLSTYGYVLYLLAMAKCLFICQAESVDDESPGDETNGSILQPKERTRSEWMACRGMPKDVCERTGVKNHELQKILAKKFDLDDIGDHLQDSSSDDISLDHCIVFSEQQLDMLIAEAKKDEKSTSTHRMKRTLIDLKKYPLSKWSMPIPYMFDGTHDHKQKETIRAAFQHWTDNTCMQFTELPLNESFDNNYILMTNQNDGCYSNLGRINRIPQQINLASVCLKVFGTVLHEIGHSLGLYHEQSRIGRSNSVIIQWSNIKMDAWSQYREADTDAVGLPYNYGSVMHYSSKGGNSLDGGDTMYAMEPLYQMNMGQRTDLSFHDKKIINLVYCKEICATPLRQPCQRGGYQNPNNCSACICPDGFSGQYCDQIAGPQNANCGGILSVVSETQEVTIKSPDFDDKGYSANQECTWWIKAPKNYTLELTFIGRFNVYCRGSVCYHWVEIKYKEDLGLEGARFCCKSRPNYVLISESNEMMVIFQSNYSVGLRRKTLLRGFKATVKPIPPVSSSINSTSTPFPTKKISSPVSSTTSTLTSKSATSVSSTTSPNTSSLRQLRLKLNLPLALRRVRLQHDLRLLVKEAT